MNQTVYLAIALSGIAIGLVLFLLSWLTFKSKKNALEKEKVKILEDARKDSERIKKDALMEAKDVVYQMVSTGY